MKMVFNAIKLWSKFSQYILFNESFSDNPGDLLNFIASTSYVKHAKIFGYSK